MRDLKLFVLFLVLTLVSCADKEILSENAEIGTNVINYGVSIDEAQKSLEGVLSDLYPETRTSCGPVIAESKTRTTTSGDNNNYEYNLRIIRGIGK